MGSFRGLDTVERVRHKRKSRIEDWGAPHVMRPLRPYLDFEGVSLWLNFATESRNDFYESFKRKSFRGCDKVTRSPNQDILN